MKTLKNRYYYTVNETLCGRIDGRHYEEFTPTAQGLFSDVSVEKQMEHWTTFVTDNTNAIAFKFVSEYLSLKVDDYCLSSSFEKLYEGNMLTTDSKTFFLRFLDWWKSTYEKYSQFITIYEANRNNLMKGALGSVTNTSDGTNAQTNSVLPTTSTYSSYPTSTDDVADGSQAKSHNVTTIVTDNATEDVIDHLEKLNDKIHDLYAEWLQTFVKRFIIYLGD